MIENVIAGFSIIMHWEHILAIVAGSSIGIVVGTIPGLTATMGVALGREGDRDAELLKDVARRGGGRISFTQSAEALPRLFSLT